MAQKKLIYEDRNGEGLGLYPEGRKHEAKRERSARRRQEGRSQRGEMVEAEKWEGLIFATEQ